MRDTDRRPGAARTFAHLAGACALVLLTYLCLKYLVSPYAWALPAWALYFIVVARTSGGTTRVLAVNAAAIAAILGAVEIGLSIAEPTQKLEQIGSTQQDDRELGYSARPGSRAVQRRYDGDRLTYAATYTIDRRGMRTLPAPASDEPRTLLLFGCSITYGIGVNDGQTFASLLQERGRHRFEVLNYAYAGYGPHQILRQLETGRVDGLVGGRRPVAAVYLSIPDHVSRAAGRAPWEVGGPHYEPRNGRAVWIGRYPPPRQQSRFRQRLDSAVRASRLCRMLLERLRLGYSPHDLDRFVAIVATAKEVVERRYGVPFVFVSMWGNDRASKAVLDRLRKEGITVVPIEELVPGFAEQSSRYRIPHDQHLSVAGHRAVADGLFRFLTR